MSDPIKEKDVKIFPLVDFSVKKRVTISMLILIVVVLGFMSLYKLPLDMMPDITFPMVTVVAQYPGVAPEEIERLVTVPMEGMVASVNRVKKVSSRSIEGASVITVEFSIPHPERVAVKMHDLAGREISSLVNQHFDAGSYRYLWDTRTFAQGCFMLKMQVGRTTYTKLVQTIH